MKSANCATAAVGGSLCSLFASGDGVLGFGYEVEEGAYATGAA
ncbi:MAG TPA: hypothetical protein VFN67_07785 [Polyangiales bacterium]|nr:hypothetical protein [Polyangiales bacterium]